MNRLWSEAMRVAVVAIVAASLMAPAATATHDATDDIDEIDSDAVLADACDGDSGFVHALEASALSDVERAKQALDDATDQLENQNPDRGPVLDLLDIGEKHAVNAAECIDAAKAYCQPFVDYARSELPSAGVPGTVRDEISVAISDLEQAPDEPTGAADTACSELSGLASATPSFAQEVRTAVQDARDALKVDDNVDEAEKAVDEALAEVESVKQDLDDEIVPVLKDVKDALHTVRTTTMGSGEEGDYARETLDIIGAWMTDGEKHDGYVDVHVLVELNRTVDPETGEHGQQQMSFDFDGPSAHYRVFATYSLTDETWSAELQSWDGAEEEWNDVADVDIRESDEGPVVDMTIPGDEVGLEPGVRIVNTQTFTYEQDTGGLSAMSTEEQLGTLTVADVAPGPIGAEYDPSDPKYGASYEAGSTYDADGDGVPDHRDNCPSTYNPHQDADACDEDPTDDEDDESNTNDPSSGSSSSGDDQNTASGPGDGGDASTDGLAVAGVPVSWILAIALVAVVAVAVGLYAAQRD